MCDVNIYMYIPLHTVYNMKVVIAGLILFMFPGKAPGKGNQGSPSASRLYVIVQQPYMETCVWYMHVNNPLHILL